MKAKQLKSIERIAAPTPTFFKKLRNAGLILAAISGAIFGAPIALPAIVIKVAGYVAVASGVLTAVSQTAVDEDALQERIVEHYDQLKKNSKV